MTSGTLDGIIIQSSFRPTLRRNPSVPSRNKAEQRLQAAIVPNGNSRENDTGNGLTSHVLADVTIKRLEPLATCSLHAAYATAQRFYTTRTTAE
ncbi:hypothetical protein V9T40_000344 [Parthenolecanium corni]|uniref:Uncharacterized protein n=1 Tax=Parthenolecanium corni TaxID=536013 RepID=A0AAN9Y1I3_9HEMI